MKVSYNLITWQIGGKSAYHKLETVDWKRLSQ